MRSLPRLAALRGTSGYSLQGLPELREAVARRFTERGAVTTPDEIMITSGALNAVNLILTAIGRRGERALVEQPTFPHALEALHRHGYRLVPTPVDTDGWDTRHLSDTLLTARPHVAYLIPDFHNPTGATLPQEERSRIATTARNTGTHLIVDETTAELDIDRGWAPVPMAAEGPNVITVGSMSKIAWGGMRIGWVRAERSVIARLLAVRPSFELGTALLEQCIAVELLDDVPALTHHVRRRLTAGRDAVAAGIADIPGMRMPATPGGLSAWIDLGAPCRPRSPSPHGNGISSSHPGRASRPAACWSAASGSRSRFPRADGGGDDAPGAGLGGRARRWSGRHRRPCSRRSDLTGTDEDPARSPGAGSSSSGAGIRLLSVRDHSPASDTHASALLVSAAGQPTLWSQTTRASSLA